MCSPPLCVGVAIEGPSLRESAVSCEPATGSVIRLTPVARPDHGHLAIAGWVSDEVARVVWELPDRDVELELHERADLPVRVFADGREHPEEITFIFAYDADGQRLGGTGIASREASSDNNTTRDDARAFVWLLSRDGDVLPSSGLRARDEQAADAGDGAELVVSKGPDEDAAGLGASRLGPLTQQRGEVLGVAGYEHALLFGGQRQDARAVQCAQRRSAASATTSCPCSASAAPMRLGERLASSSSRIRSGPRPRRTGTASRRRPAAGGCPRSSVGLWGWRWTTRSSTAR